MEPSEEEDESEDNAEDVENEKNTEEQEKLVEEVLMSMNNNKRKRSLGMKGPMPKILKMVIFIIIYT